MSEEMLAALDTLLDHLRTALKEKNWDELSRLNQLVKPTVDPMMRAVEAGELDAAPLRHRLSELQTFCDRANISAKEAKAEAKAALAGVDQNRKAARAYQNVSSNPQK